MNDEQRESVALGFDVLSSDVANVAMLVERSAGGPDSASAEQVEALREAATLLRGYAQDIRDGWTP